MKKRRGYFKHYNDASRGETLSVLARRQEYLAICIYWHLLEILNQRNSNQGSVYIESLCSLYNCKTKTVIASLTACRELATDLEFTLENSKVVFSIANYAEYQETRGQKMRKSETKDAPIKDKRLKIKDNIIDPLTPLTSETEYNPAKNNGNNFINNETEKQQTELDIALASVMTALPPQAKSSWASMYGGEQFVSDGLLTAFNYYYSSGQHKKMKAGDWSRAFNSWLNKSWKRFSEQKIESNKRRIQQYDSNQSGILSLQERPNNYFNNKPNIASLLNNAIKTM